MHNFPLSHKHTCTCIRPSERQHSEHISEHDFCLMLVKATQGPSMMHHSTLKAPCSSDMCDAYMHTYAHTYTQLKGHTGAVNDASFNTQGTMLASCSSDMCIKLWDFTQSYECTKTLRGHEHTVSSVQWLPSNDMVVSASRDCSIRIWEVYMYLCINMYKCIPCV
jgi:WD40 repeat protein